MKEVALFRSNDLFEKENLTKVTQVLNDLMKKSHGSS
jgi:hypothetical protein